MAGVWTTLDILTRTTTTHEQLLSLVNDASDEFLRAHAYGPSTAAAPREILANGVAERDGTSADADDLVLSTAGSWK